MARKGVVVVDTRTIQSGWISDYPVAQALRLKPKQLVEIIDIKCDDPELGPLFGGILTILGHSFVAQKIGGCVNGLGIKLAVPWFDGSKPICQAASKDRLLKHYPQFEDLECERNRIVVLDMNTGGDPLLERFVLETAQMLERSSFSGGEYAILRDPNSLPPNQAPCHSLVVAFEADEYASSFVGLAG